MLVNLRSDKKVPVKLATNLNRTCDPEDDSNVTLRNVPLLLSHAFLDGIDPADVFIQPLKVIGIDYTIKVDIGRIQLIFIGARIAACGKFV